MNYKCCMKTPLGATYIDWEEAHTRVRDSSEKPTAQCNEARTCNE
jgi:hypothetical protein